LGELTVLPHTPLVGFPGTASPQGRAMKDRKRREGDGRKWKERREEGKGKGGLSRCFVVWGSLKLASAFNTSSTH